MTTAASQKDQAKTTKQKKSDNTRGDQSIILSSSKKLCDNSKIKGARFMITSQRKLFLPSVVDVFSPYLLMKGCRLRSHFPACLPSMSDGVSLKYRSL